VKALVNRAGSLRELEKIDQMLATLDRAITLDPKHAKALVARGNLLEEIKRPDTALADYQRVLALAPDEPMIFSCVASASIRACDWSGSEQIKHRLERDVAEGRTVHPFTFLTYSSDPLLQLECAKRSIGESIPVRPHPLWQGNVYSHERIRIAYLSADFRQHPTAYLTAELFELHDRSRFEVLGISFGFDDRTPIRARLAKAFDEFHDVIARSDAEIAKLLNEREVDIAIDLMGFTTHGRTSILAHRPAPIAVNYLGYPGSIGAPFIDYIIADPTVLPPEHEQFCAEKVAWLPDCYQVNDRNRRIAEHAPRRREAGLPDRGFVFCCFNNNYKITAPVFDVWMRLLRAIDGA
jgi:protein O-GlcNAc transferase